MSRRARAIAAKAMRAIKESTWGDLQVYIKVPYSKVSTYSEQGKQRKAGVQTIRKMAGYGPSDIVIIGNFTPFYEVNGKKWKGSGNGLRSEIASGAIDESDVVVVFDYVWSDEKDKIDQHKHKKMSVPGGGTLITR
jgi:hypothetical protein